MSYNNNSTTMDALYDQAEELEDCHMLDALCRLPLGYVGPVTFVDDDDRTWTVNIVG